MQVSDLLPLALDEKEGKEILSHYLQASEDQNDIITFIRQYHSVQTSEVWTVLYTVFLFHLRRNSKFQFQQGIYPVEHRCFVSEIIPMLTKKSGKQRSNESACPYFGVFTRGRVDEVLEAPVLLALVLENLYDRLP